MTGLTYMRIIINGLASVVVYIIAERLTVPVVAVFVAAAAFTIFTVVD